MEDPMSRWFRWARSHGTVYVTQRQMRSGVWRYQFYTLGTGGLRRLEGGGAEWSPGKNCFISKNSAEKVLHGVSTYVDLRIEVLQ